MLPYLDSSVVISRSRYQEGLLPAVDMLLSTSAALNVDIAGEQHFNALIGAQSLLKRAVSLERIVSLVGESELSNDDKIDFRRSRLLRNYMTQNFFVMEQQTGKKGAYVPLQTVIGDVSDILGGVYDGLPEDKLLYVGSAKEGKV